ncbi:MAG: ABC transporter ATP-binding protein [Treponema sp.]|nr:ABC transporter ATP-binding protein [Treponema sp.]
MNGRPAGKAGGSGAVSGIGASPAPILEVRGLDFSYGERAVLRDINFSLERGELLGMLGPNGVGKSTLFRCILGLEKRHSGTVLLGGENIKDKPPRLMAQAVAYVPQTHYPSFNYSVMDMVLMGTAAQGKEWASPDARQRRNARDALERLGIAEFGGRDFVKLSGGEQQLVLIARALAQQARLLVMDEPTANLDYGNQIRVLLQVKALSGQGYSIIMSTHNPEHAFLFAGRVLALHDSRIAAAGPPADILTPELIRALYGVEVRLHRDGAGRTSCMPLLL